MFNLVGFVCVIQVVFWTKLGGDGDGPACLNGYSACSQATFSQPVTAISVAPVQDSMKRYNLIGGPTRHF